MIRLLGKFSFAFDDKSSMTDKIVPDRTNQPVFGDGLLSTLGEQHRRQRKMLNPVFSIAHMKRMIPTFFDITFQVRLSLFHSLVDRR